MVDPTWTAPSADSSARSESASPANHQCLRFAEMAKTHLKVRRTE
jgi:hypothetical protein